MASEVKIGRLESLILQTLNETILKEVRDPIAKNARVTAVRLSNDLSVAKIFFDTRIRSTMPDVLVAINKVSGLLRSKLSQVWSAHKLPELRFVSDETIDYAQKIDALFKKIKDDEEQNK
ncbi:ribosome-binding factor A [Ureaplasma diversum]|uniref:Ribosome-binding factor A n=1 Tax=Ureaplasma diversum TaxID=42094 RepID=A0A0C5S1I4_9BACT|nr:30S ribosome-binding factor RbfA [Ureaplasma diversum]AJQ45245.1 ribosome-binding factor A [Ureaplasma diversum]